MRILFIGLNDHNGWMYEYSKLINKHTDVVSNCILTFDSAGYGADIVLKEKGSKINKLSIPDKRALIDSFAKDTDVFIFNGCDVQHDGFRYGKVNWNDYIRCKDVYFFVGDQISDKNQVFNQFPSVLAMTNQPKVYSDFTDSRRTTLSLMRPFLDLDPIYALAKKDKKTNSFLYRDEGDLKNIKNLDTFLMIFSFIFSELGNIDYVSYVGQPYGEAKRVLGNYDFSFDMLYPLGGMSRASIEAAACGMINFVGMPYKYSKLFSEACGCNENIFENIVNERDLYERAKMYILNSELKKQRQAEIQAQAYVSFDGSKISDFISLL